MESQLRPRKEKSRIVTVAPSLVLRSEIPSSAPLLQATAYSDEEARAAKAMAFDGFTVFDPRP